MNFGAHITLSAFTPGQCIWVLQDSRRSRLKLCRIPSYSLTLDQLTLAVWNPNGFTRYNHTEISVRSVTQTGIQAPHKRQWSKKVQHPIQRVHPATLFCTADISEAKIEWANNGKCKRIEFPCWNSMCHCSCQRQVISYSNNQRFSFGHWIEYMTLILDSAWFKRYLHLHFYIYHRAAEMHRFSPSSKSKQ